MTYKLMQLWTDKVFGQRSRDLFHIQKSVLFMDECSAHKKAELLILLKCQKTVLKLIPLKTTAYLQSLAICVHAQWEDWFANGEKSIAKGHPTNKYWIL